MFEKSGAIGYLLRYESTPIPKPTLTTLPAHLVYIPIHLLSVSVNGETIPKDRKLRWKLGIVRYNLSKMLGWRAELQERWASRAALPLSEAEQRFLRAA